MTTTRPRPAGQASPTAGATRLREAVEHLHVVFTVHLAWLGLTLLGLVIAGIAPASCAAAAALAEFRRDEKVPVLPLMWEVYRREFVSSSLRMLPLLAVQLLSAAMLWQVAGGLGSRPALTAVLGVLAALSTGWVTVSLAALAVAPRVRDQALLVSWRMALLMPGALPVRSIALVLLLFAWTAVASWVWPLALLLGGGVAIDRAVALLGTRIELLLVDLSGGRTV